MSSTADTDDVIEVSADGLSVRKSFTADEFPVPAIKFEIESEREEPVTFRLSESIPESFPMDRVGFHPDYDSDNWTAFQDNHVEFTGAVDATDDLLTVYGIRIDDDTDIGAFLTEPTIVEVSSEPTDSTDSEAAVVEDDVIGNIVSPDRNQAVKDMIAGETDSVPGLEDEDTDSESPIDEDDHSEADPDEELDLSLGTTDGADEDGDTDERDSDEDAPDIDLDFEEDDIPAAAEEDDDESELELDLDHETDTNKADEDDAADGDEGVTAEPAEEPEIALDLEEDDIEGDDTAEDAGENTAEDTDDNTTEDTDDNTAEDTDDNTTEDTDDNTADTETDMADSTDTTAPVEATQTDTAPSGDTTERADAVALEGTVGATLAAELRDGEIDDDDLDVLQDALDLEQAGTDVAKFDHLQSRVEEVAAYTNALEEFLDENGTGTQLIQDVQEGLESIESDLENVDDQVAANGRRLTDTESELETVSTDVDTALSGLESVESDVTTVEAELEETTDEVSAVEDDLETVSAEVSGLESDVGSLDDDISTVTDDLETVTDDIDELHADLEDVRGDVTDIQEWRDQLGSMFSD